MPSKDIKLHSGTRVSVKSYRLANGNLVIPQRMKHDRSLAEFVEVAPGSSEHKRWLPVACDEPDPRRTKQYKAWRAGLPE